MYLSVCLSCHFPLACLQARPGEQRRIHSLQAAVAALQRLVAELQRACGWKAHSIHLMGFSQVQCWQQPSRQPESVGCLPDPGCVCCCEGFPDISHCLPSLQGGTVALGLARQQQAAGQPLGSCVAVSAALLPEQVAQGLGAGSKSSSGGANAAGGGTPILITHGTADKGTGWLPASMTASPGLAWAHHVPSTPPIHCFAALQL